MTFYTRTQLHVQSDIDRLTTIVIAVAKFAERNQSYCVMYIDESVHVLRILNMIDKVQYLLSIQ